MGFMVMDFGGLGGDRDLAFDCVERIAAEKLLQVSYKSVTVQLQVSYKSVTVQLQVSYRSDAGWSRSPRRSCPRRQHPAHGSGCRFQGLGFGV